MGTGRTLPGHTTAFAHCCIALSDYFTRFPCISPQLEARPQTYLQGPHAELTFAVGPHLDRNCLGNQHSSFKGMGMIQQCDTRWTRMSNAGVPPADTHTSAWCLLTKPGQTATPLCRLCEARLWKQLGSRAAHNPVSCLRPTVPHVNSGPLVTRSLHRTARNEPLRCAHVFVCLPVDAPVRLSRVHHRSLQHPSAYQSGTWTLLHICSCVFVLLFARVFAYLRVIVSSAMLQSVCLTAFPARLHNTHLQVSACLSRALFARARARVYVFPPSRAEVRCTALLWGFSHEA